MPLSPLNRARAKRPFERETSCLLSINTGTRSVTPVPWPHRITLTLSGPHRSPSSGCLESSITQGNTLMLPRYAKSHTMWYVSPLLFRAIIG